MLCTVYKRKDAERIFSAGRYAHDKKPLYYMSAKRGEFTSLLHGKGQQQKIFLHLNKGDRGGEREEKLPEKCSKNNSEILAAKYERSDGCLRCSKRRSICPAFEIKSTINPFVNNSKRSAALVENSAVFEMARASLGLIQISCKHLLRCKEK